jgi:hypothetical protein
VNPKRPPVAVHAHHTERRQHHVEALVLERQLLGVPLDPLDLDSGLGGQRATGNKQLRRQVHPDHPASCRRGPERGIPRAACDVQDVLVPADPYPAYQPFPHNPQLQLRNGGKVPDCPARSSALLDLGQSWCGLYCHVQSLSCRFLLSP